MCDVCEDSDFDLEEYVKMIPQYRRKMIDACADLVYLSANGADSDAPLGCLGDTGWAGGSGPFHVQIDDPNPDMDCDPEFIQDCYGYGDQKDRRTLAEMMNDHAACDLWNSLSEDDRGVVRIMLLRSHPEIVPVRFRPRDLDIEFKTLGLIRYLKGQRVISSEG